MNPDEASSAALHLSLEEEINQVGKRVKLINPISWQYLYKFMLDVIRALELGTQEIPTLQQLYLRQSVRKFQKHEHLNASEPN